MAQTAADRLIEVLQEWGVEVVFGLPGDGINGLMEALRRRQDRIRFVQVRHEESAAFMACGYAKFTGRLGVCLAKLDGQSGLALTGMLPRPHQYVHPAGRRARQSFRGCLGLQRANHGPDVAFVGDGAFSMLMAEFATCVKYGLPVKVVILKNNSLGMIKWEQMVFLGLRSTGASCTRSIFAAFARACGGVGFTVDDPAECGPTLEHALATPGPVIVEAVVDPHTPPMPPKVTVEQAKHFGEALVKGQPNGEKIALTVLSDTVRELV